MQAKRSLLATAILLPILSLLLFSGCSNEGKNKEQHYKKAMTYLDQKKEKEATIELRNAIQIDPMYAEAHYQLGLLHLKTGEARHAFEELQRAATLDPKNIDAKIKTAEFYLLSKKKDEARKNVAEVLNQAPENKDALALLANLELIDGKLDAALTAIDKALAKSPNEDRLYAIKGHVLAMQQHLPEAEKAFLKALELDGRKISNYATLTAFYVEGKELDKAKATLKKMAVALPGSPQPFLQMATLELMQNDMEDAEQHLIQALKIDPKNSKLKASVAEFYAKRGKLEQAEQLYRDAIESAEKPEDLEAELANFYFDHGKSDQAKAELERVVKKNEKNATANLVKAKFALQDGNNQEALAITTELTRDYPKWGEVFFTKALALSNLDDQKMAKEAVLEAIKLQPGFDKAHSLLALLALQEGDFATAKNEAATALQINPRDFQAALILAKGMLFSKDYATAEKMLNGLHAYAPENIEILGSLGLTYMAMQNTAMAKQTFEKLLTLQPGNAKAFTFILQIAQEGGAPKDALIKMTQAQIEKVPTSGELHILLGNLLLSNNQPDIALETYNRAQELAPENPQPYTMSALILTNQGKTDQAIAEYLELLAKQPEAIGAYMGLGSIYEQTGKDNLAQDAYEKILTIKPDFAPAANNLAWMLAESKDPDLGEALRLAMTAKQLLPDDAHIIDTLGWVYYRRGSFDRARNEFDQAVQKQEDMPILRYHLALALYGEGKKQEAIKEVERALSQKQPFKEHEEAAATLHTWQSEK